MGECGQGGNPDGVSYCCRVGACTCAAVPGAAIGALTLPCELISSSSTIFTVGCPLIVTIPKVQSHNSFCFNVSQLTPLCPIPNAQLAGFLSTTTQVRVARPFTGSSKQSAWFVSFFSSVFVLSPASVTVALCVRRRTIASCTLAARPMFSESSSHTAHTVFSSSLERSRKLRNQLLYTLGNCGSV